MSVERASEFLSRFGMEDKIITFKDYLIFLFKNITSFYFHNSFTSLPHMLPFAEVEEQIGHAPGGVCPFGVNEGVKVYLDISMKRFPTMFPAAGEENNAIELTPEELEKYTVNEGWVDLCKGWQEN